MPVTAGMSASSHGRSNLLHHCAADSRDITVECLAVDPAHHRYQVEFGINISHVLAVADMTEHSFGRAWEHFAAGIEKPVHESVAGVRPSGRQRHRNPLV